MPVIFGSGSFQARRTSVRWPTIHQTGKPAERLPDRVSLSPDTEPTACGSLGKLKPPERRPFNPNRAKVRNPCGVCGLPTGRKNRPLCFRHRPREKPRVTYGGKHLYYVFGTEADR